ncbi:GNAT family protein [Sulfitobacter faviae]|uniref:GNAT family protein n=1 Tax=Sulfitobacter faviae TaxID=1775881 RepID=A0ABZ0V470_9RHOB|nr:GNAT family protein [Sulfitobacter faviae]WPZ22195.1 GNAT family protein [Sulfitobacter faviae]
MNSRTDPRPVGPLVENWSEPPRPGGEVLTGQHVVLEPLSAEKHAALLYPAYLGEDHVWDYLAYGPFSSAAQYHRWVRDSAGKADPYFMAVKDRARDQWLGVASFLRIKPEAGSIEVGHINFSPALQRTPAATEAIFLMMQWAFEAGYRRFEWKCDALNRPSRRAAQRLGLSYEGVFRQATIVKGRNRDTAWFAAIDTEWPALKEAFEVWLAPGNFDGQGQQKERLGDLTRLVRVAGDPTL